MVLDSQSAALPVPVEREVGGVRVRELRMLDYPYFVDARGEGLADGSAPTAGLHELTMSWASPIRLDRAALGERQAVELVTSSPAAWTADSTQIAPDYRAHPEGGFATGEDTGRKTLAVAVEGSFESYLDRKSTRLNSRHSCASRMPPSA